MRDPLRLPGALAALAILAAGCHHSSSSTAGSTSPAGPSPRLLPTARYQDLNLDGVLGPGDRVVLRFSFPVRVNSSDPASLDLPVLEDAFGAGATIVQGPDTDEISIMIGTGATLRTRGLFAGLSEARSATGISIAAAPAPDSIEHAINGQDAISDEPADLWPELVPGIQSGLSITAARMVASDLNLDGYTDLIAADGLIGVHVFESLASGGFTSLNLPGGNAFDVLAVDLFSAGREDLAVLSDSKLILFENLSPTGGSVTLGSHDMFQLPDTMSCLESWDYDHDGDRDIVLAGQAGLWVYENMGGWFQAPDEALPGTPAGGRDLAIGDFSRNGVEDVLVALPGQNILYRPFLCGGGQLVAQGTNDSDHVALVDLDRDGVLDAVSAGDGPIEIWRGTSSGIFEFHWDIQAGIVTSLAVRDLDDDGIPDLLFGEGSDLRTFAGIGDGTFRELDFRIAPGLTTGMTFGDIDGDGDDDLGLVADGRPQVWAASAAATFGSPRPREAPFDAGAGPMFSSVVHDYDRDGVADLAIGRDQRIELRRGLGNGDFEAPEILALPDGRATDLAFGDVDGDGDQDLVASILGEGPLLWIDSGGTYFPVPLHPVGTIHRGTAIALGDFTGDGFPEIVMGTVRGQQDRFYRNGGGDCTTGDSGDQTYWQGFNEPQVFSGTQLTADIALGDVDHDGDLDILMAHKGGDPDRLFFGDGLGAFGLSPLVFPSENTSAVTIGDVDGDGDNDLVAGGELGTRVMLGDGASGFTPATFELDQVQVSQVHLARINGDATADLLVGHRFHRGWRTFRGVRGSVYPDGTWRRAPADAVETLVVGDFDRDGALDFFTGSDSVSAENRIWLGR